MLHIVAEWLLSSLKTNHALFVDLASDNRFKPISEVFHTLRPDIVIVDRASQSVNTLEFTICHETNMQKSKLYKTNKYDNLFNYLTSEYCLYTVHSHTIEISTLGFVSDITQFCKINLKNCMPDTVHSKILLSVVTDSFMVYCNRNVIQARQ